MSTFGVCVLQTHTRAHQLQNAQPPKHFILHPHPPITIAYALSHYSFFQLFQYYVHFFKTLNTTTISVDYGNKTVDTFLLLRYKMHSLTTSSKIHGYLPRNWSQFLLSNNTNHWSHNVHLQHSKVCAVYKVLWQANQQIKQVCSWWHLCGIWGILGVDEIHGKRECYSAVNVKLITMSPRSGFGLQETSGGSLMCCCFTYCTGKEKCQHIFFVL